MVALPCRFCSRAASPLTSATDVVIIAIACMALNILVGYTGLRVIRSWRLASAWARMPRRSHSGTGFPARSCRLACSRSLSSSSAAVLIAFLVLRRRGVYFSLLTLAFSALCYAVAFRWTALTGGENGLGGVSRASWLGVDLDRPWVYYIARRARSASRVVLAARRASTARPSERVLVAHPRKRAARRFVGYPRALQADRLRAVARC